jgi:hypothetical protein
MGTGTFFSKMASFDPLAHALHLPGANKYEQLQASQAAGNSSRGPYQGVAPTLAGANAGYAAGGPGSNPNYTPWTMPTIGNGWQRFAASQGSKMASPWGPQDNSGVKTQNMGGGF